MLGQKQVERVGDVGLQVFARDDGIEKAVLQQELGGLKTLGQLLANGLLDDARAGETDQRAGLGDVQITQHGVAGGHAAGGGVGEHGYVRHARLVQAGQRRRNLGELHQANRAFHHPRAARAGNNHQRQLLFHRQLDGPRHFLPYDRSHRPTDKAEFHRTANQRPAIQKPFGSDDGVAHAELLLRLFEARHIGLGVHKPERVGGSQVCVVLEPPAVEQQLEPPRGAQLEVMLALGTYLPVVLQVFLPDDGAAGVALDPQTLGAHAALIGWRRLLDRLFLSFEPSHFQKLEVRCSIVNASLGQNTLRIRGLDLAPLGNQVRQFHQLGIGIAAGADHVHALGTFGQGLDHFFRVEHTVADDVVDFIEHHEIVLPAVDLRAAELPGLLAEPEVFRVGFRASDLDEAAAHRTNLHLIVAQHFRRVEFAIMPRAFDELHHQHARSEEHTSELQSLAYLVCRLLLEKKKKILKTYSRFQIAADVT